MLTPGEFVFDGQDLDGDVLLIPLVLFSFKVYYIIMKICHVNSVKTLMASQKNTPHTVYL